MLNTNVKGTQVQKKSVNIVFFTWKQYANNFPLQDVLVFGIYAFEICERFYYKQTKTMEFVNI